MTDMRGASRVERRAAAKYMAKQNAKYPAHLVQLPADSWDRERPGAPIEIWRSMFYLVQIYAVDSGLERMSVNRAALEPKTGGWSQDIPWEDLQMLKEQCGRGEFDAVEIYPRSVDVVNVANMRHLWILREGRIPFAWRNKGAAP